MQHFIWFMPTGSSIVQICEELLEPWAYMYYAEIKANNHNGPEKVRQVKSHPPDHAYVFFLTGRTLPNTNL